MKRRALLLLPVLAGCGLTDRPYVERRQWPLQIGRPATLPARTAGRVLEVRTLRAGPGLDVRGLQELQPDGSIRTGFYEEWAVAPAQAVEDALRRWLADSGLFAAVTAPGSRAVPDIVVEGELTALWTEPASKLAHAALAVTAIAQRGDAPRVLLQRNLIATAALPGNDPQVAVQGMIAALSVVLAQTEAALRATL